MRDDSPHVRVFPARLGAVPEVSEFAGDAARAAGFDRDTRLRLTLLVEELFTNTVAHGHGGDSEKPVRVAFDVTPGRVALTYEDTGPEHDPFAAIDAPDATAGVEERRVGGLGVILVAAMASGVEYRRVEGRNRISLVITAPPASRHDPGPCPC